MREYSAKAGGGSGLPKGLRWSINQRILYKSQVQELQNQTFSNVLTFKLILQTASVKKHWVKEQEKNNPKFLFKIKQIYLTSSPTVDMTK